MRASCWRLSEAELRGWLDGLLDGGQSVIAPVDEDGLRIFRPLASAGEASLVPGKTRWSPKEYLFPRTEPLYSYAFSNGGVVLHDPPGEDREQILFGLACCDAAGLARLDAVFLSGEPDPFYASRRARTVVVALACDAAGPECFCVAVGGSPAGEVGSDLIIVPIGDALLVQPLSERGASLTAPHASGWAAATKDDRKRARQQRRRVEESMGQRPLDPDLASVLEEAFDDSIWQRLGERCLSCSICASVCPSCSCFDVHQEGDVWRGVESRCWDSCTFALFTRHASGHNPRADQGTRYRQRVLHKFAYRSHDDQGVFRCLGCGRCIALCPAGIDIHTAAREVVEAAEKGGADGDG